MLRFTPRHRSRQRHAPVTAYGALTGVNLGQVRPLCRPLEPDSFGRLRPPLDPTAMKLSLELAQTTYFLEVEPWMQSGWDDVSIQVDDLLESGVTVGESESARSEHMRGLINSLKLTRARYALKELNPVAQLFSALRQRKGSDTIKAVTMIHKTDDGRYVVGIGFMGTGSRFYDWFSNFRFTTENGFHKGFKQLSDYFEQTAERIFFPQTAEELGLERLSLMDVVREMRSTESRFSLWMAGHSQGAAVMQVFCHDLLYEWNVQPSLVVGYGFASPTVATRRHPRDPAAYPLYHILNSDDFVPRMGAEIHLGQCLQFDADASFRAECYGWKPDVASQTVRNGVRDAMQHCTNTTEIMESSVALLYATMEVHGAESLNTILHSKRLAALTNRVLLWSGKDAGYIIERFARIFKLGYRSLTGHEMDDATIQALQAQLCPLLRATPTRKLLAGISEVCYAPHHLMRERGTTIGAYACIVLRHMSSLRSYIWSLDEGEPQRVFGLQPRWSRSETAAKRRVHRRRVLRRTAGGSVRDHRISHRRHQLMASR